MKTQEQRDRHAAYMRERYARNLPEARAKNRLYARSQRLRTKYGVDGATWKERRYQEIGGRCESCGVEAPCWGYDGLRVDHCHFTGEVRGLICERCNQVTGAIEDDRFIQVIEYLKRTERSD